MAIKAPRDVLVVDIGKVYRAPSLERLRDPVEQYKAKFATLRVLKFDPFVLGCTVVVSPHRSDVSALYFQKSFQGLMSE